jgi:hypothetical protein
LLLSFCVQLVHFEINLFILRSDLFIFKLQLLGPASVMVLQTVFGVGAAAGVCACWSLLLLPSVLGVLAAASAVL